MTSGTWDEVHKRLFTCPSLSDLKPENLMYAREGESSHFKVFNYFPREDSWNILSDNNEDESYIIKLVRKLVERGGGKESYPCERGETDCISYSSGGSTDTML